VGVSFPDLNRGGSVSTASVSCGLECGIQGSGGRVQGLGTRGVRAGTARELFHAARLFLADYDLGFRFADLGFRV